MKGSRGRSNPTYSKTMNLKKIFSAAILGAAAATAAADDAPRYIFYFIGDGMGVQPSNAAEVYNRRVRNSDRPLAMNTFTSVGWLTTYSATGPVTDSAAAGSALACGRKTLNGMLGMTPDSVSMASVAEELFAEGYGVGLATSVAADDATPGAFYAHVPSRKMYYQICRDMAASGYQFVGGAGIRGFVADGDSTDLAAHLAAEGVQVVYGPEGISTIDSDRVLLLNPKGKPEWNIGYTIDSIAGVLTLPQLTGACLAQLERTSPERFFMMVEGGNIDHALHGNDGGAAIKEIINFNEAIEIALEFYAAHPEETLVIVTADHDTGGSSLLYSSGTGLRYIDYQKVSKEKFSEYCKSLLDNNTAYSWDDMEQYLRDNLGLFGPVPVDDSDTASLRSKFDTTFALRDSADQHTLYANFNAFAVEVFRVFNKAIGIGFTTTGHSGNPVPVYAIGCGAERFTGFTDNTDIPARIRAITHSDD